MTPWVTRLLVANVVVFLLQASVPGLVREFGFLPVAVLARPWTLVTYLFLHGGFGHLALNMLSLYFFGVRLEARIGSGHFVRLYFASGLMGAVLSLFLQPGAYIIGASGAVFGVMLGFAYYWPRERIYIWGVLPVEARWLVVGTTLLSVFGGFSGRLQPGVAHFAHLGGYLGGWLYLWVMNRRLTAGRREWRQRVNAEVVPVPIVRIPDIELERIHPVNRDEVARILAKARAGGLASLTNQERTFLSHFTPAPVDAPPVQ